MSYTTPEAWGPRKAAGGAGEFGGLPIVKIGEAEGVQQTNAILRSLGIKYGYYNPTNWQQSGRIDQLVETWGEVFNAFGAILIDATLSNEERQTKVEGVRDGILKKFLTMSEKELERNAEGENFVVGAEITIADFCLAALIFNILKNQKGGSPFSAVLEPVLAEYPKFTAYATNLETVLKPHLSTRQDMPF